MAEVKDYGELFTADILVVGGSMSGLTTAIRAKENNPELDILVIDKGIIGWNGQSTKAGNGIRSTSKHPDGVMNALGYLVHAHTPFLNDQEFLKRYLEVHRDNIDYMKHCGVQVSCDEDGNATPLTFIPDALDMAGVSINVNAQLRAFALKLGIRLMSRVNVFELLTSKTGKVIGAIGFGMDKGECKIFHAKAVAMATQGCHFKKIGLEFMGYGTGVGAMYRVGAVMRNVEFSTQVDVVFKKTNTPIYGGFNMICNKCSATRFLRNRDRIDEKKSPILRSISEARSLASTAPKTRGAAHARGRAFLGSGRSGFCRPSLCLLPSCGGLPFRLLVRAFCGLLGPFLGLHGLGVLRPAIDAGLPYVRVNVGRPLLAVVGNLRALAICVVCPEGLHPVGELLERVADLCPHGGRLRGFSVLPGVGDVMDGAVELPLVLDDVARLASPILVPCDKELGIFCDGGVVELLGLGRFNEHKLGDGLGGVTPLLSVRDCLDGLLRC